MIYQREISDVTFVSESCGMTCLKQLSHWKNYIFLWGPKTKLTRLHEKKYLVFAQIIKKLTDYYFMILDLGTASFVNGYFSTELKENDPLIKYFGPMYIDFDEYLRYSAIKYAIFEKKVN